MQGLTVSLLISFVYLSVEGNVYSWGDNRFGQLGIDSEANSRKPRKVTKFKDIYIEKVACGDTHMLALSGTPFIKCNIAATGKVFACGSNSHGELGIGNNESKRTPEEVEFAELAGKKEKIESIHCGANFSAAITGESA